MTPTRTRRRGVTLVELLVVISILTALLALALMIVPNVSQQNAVQNAAGEIQAAFKTAQGMATVAKLPRGVRFLVDPVGGTNSAGFPNSGYTATALQYLETPPIVVSDPRALVAPLVGGADPNGPYVSYGPRVEFSYDLAPGPNPPQNAIINRHCYLRGLTLDQAGQVAAGAVLTVPPLGSWARITSATYVAPSSGTVITGALNTGIATSTPPYAYNSYRLGNGTPVADLEVVLEVYPDAGLGTATAYRSYQFALYGAPVPLLAEPTVPLPDGVAADLLISYPALATAGANYDVMFSPDGPTTSSTSVAANVNVYIWVRDTTKITNPAGTGSAINSLYPGDFGANYAAFVDAFRRGGEQALVGVRAGGFVGPAPVAWPTAGGSFAAYDPFALARQSLGR